ncbi:MAG: ribbon-helix-helix protein, CopG family, partial [Calditrichae bacterium]|nr:ribbon-helix-helix protein, CopG family [Calditrichia bacterium]
MELIRYGISLPEILSRKFDRLIKKKKYTNRSEAIRDLIRHALVE